jgi:hypothetical protein
MAILSLPLTAHWTTLHFLPERSEGPGLFAVDHYSMSKPCTNIKGKFLRFAQDDSAGGLVLRSAQDDNAKRLIDGKKLDAA